MLNVFYFFEVAVFIRNLHLNQSRRCSTYRRLEPTNQWYAIAKIAGIKMVMHYASSTAAICLMPTNLYGQGDNYHSTNSHVIPAMIRRFYEAVESNASHVTCWVQVHLCENFYMLTIWDPPVCLFWRSGVQVNSNLIS